MHMVVHLLIQKGLQNNSIKGEHEEVLYVALEGPLEGAPTHTGVYSHLQKKAYS